MAIIGEKITLDKTLVGNIARNQMESKMELTTKGALYVGTGKANSVTPDGGGDAVPIPITSHIAPNGARDNGKVLVADSNETVGWKLDVGANIVYKKMSGSLPTSGWTTPDEGWKDSTMPANRNWFGVTYGNGKFVVVVHNSAYGAYSTDGINWTETNLPANKSWQSVTYGNGKYVAVAQNTEYGAYSLDGINWTETTMPASRDWRSVTYGDGKYVAIAGNTEYGAYSLDGINWTEFTLPASYNWNSVTYGNGKFVVVTYNNKKGVYSTDGITWTEMTMPASRYWQSVTYGNGKYVAVAQNTEYGAYSLDGINWTETTMPANIQWRGVTYGDGKYVAVADGIANKGAYSTDGINWAEFTMPANRNWANVTYGNGKFVAVAYNSTNGAYWKAAAQVTYTITDTFITANTSVKMYLTDEGGVKAYSKESGAITVIRGAVPTSAIPYEYEVEQTSAEGLFEVINAYVPTKTSQLTNDSGFITSADIPQVGEWITVTGTTATLTEAGTYQVIAGVTDMQSIVYWDGKTQAYGTRNTLPLVTANGSDPQPSIYCAYPHIGSNGQLSVQYYYISTTWNNSSYVWHKTDISNFSGFKYRKIH